MYYIYIYTHTHTYDGHRFESLGAEVKALDAADATTAGRKMQQILTAMHDVEQVDCMRHAALGITPSAHSTPRVLCHA